MMKNPRDLKYYDLAREQRRAAAAHARYVRKEKESKAALAEIEAKIRAELVADKLESQRVAGYNYTPSFRDIAEVVDREAYLAYASRPENRDLLYKSVNMTAATERWNEARIEAEEAGMSAKSIAGILAKTIPGVLPGRVPTLSVTKAKPTKGARR